MNINRFDLVDRHPFEFINQFATINRTKRYIDDILTVSLLGHISGLSLEDILSQDGTFYGMYPTTVRGFDGGLRPFPISMLRDQQRPSIHFLDIYEDRTIDPGNL